MLALQSNFSGNESLEAGGISENPNSIRESELAEAFAHFCETAVSLEASYARLRAEVARLRAELDQAHRDLAQEREQSRRHRALVEISTMLAHEVRNPLASLELFARWLLESDLTGEQQEWLGHIQAGIRTLGATVHNVLQWHNPCPIRLLSLDFGTWLDQVVGYLAPLARQAGVQLETKNRLHGVSALADGNALQQMTLNLALNAFRVMPGGGTLRLSGHMSGESPAKICLEFRDDGPGIDVNNLTRIFEAGFSAMSGPGLGLAVCRTIVQRHDGHVAACNPAGGGACFLVELPLRTQCDEEQEEEPGSEFV